ncbi:MAG: hypothetical protein IPK73_11945 [Candidatus Obscuribacter sp.]|nr:hypothetical protein [Candidatus Obscuribacter sp.]MBK9281732.1 hypothetical protein [Candidatus Obscuribacter sp.]
MKTSVIAERQLTIRNEFPAVKFVRNLPKDSPIGWYRHLLVHDKPAYFLGNVCGSCSFLFQKEGTDTPKVDTARIAKELNSGLSSISDTVIEAARQILPSGEYQVYLLEVSPKLVESGAEEDYFSKEQPVLWEDEPESTETEYYRCRDRKFAKRAALYEFIAPSFHHDKLDQNTITDYRRRIAEGERPTAIAISVLDTKQPALWDEKLEIIDPRCLVHFLLDGHHKTYAAAAEHKPITILSFLHKQECVATNELLEESLRSL